MNAHEVEGLSEAEARAFCSRFDECVFLLAAGLRERDEQLEGDPAHYAYSGVLRHGLGMLAVLVAEAVGRERAAALSGLSETGFTRDWATRPVCEWARGWRAPYARAVEECRHYPYGPLVVVEGSCFALTEECLDVLCHAERDLVGGYEERVVFEYLRAGTQDEYVLGRRLLIRHPLLTRDEHARLMTMRAALGDDPLDQGEGLRASAEWVRGLVAIAYEEVPSGMRKCPRCGWSMGMRGRQVTCVSGSCVARAPRDVRSLPELPAGSWRLKRGVMGYVGLPGRLELDVAELARDGGLSFRLWPGMDACDVEVTLRDGRRVAVDAKAYATPERLAREMREDVGIASLGADWSVYVVPDDLTRGRPGYCRIVNASLAGRRAQGCLTLSGFRRWLTHPTEEGLHVRS